MHPSKEHPSLDDKKQYLHLLELQLRLLELEANRLRACCSSSSISFTSVAKTNLASNLGSAVSLQSATDVHSRPPSPLASSSSSPHKFLRSSPRSFDSHSSNSDFERYPNFLGKKFLLNLAEAASQELFRDLEALELESQRSASILLGKIEAYKAETQNLKATRDAAEKFGSKVTSGDGQQFYRWISKHWLGNTERDLRWLKLKIVSDQKYQKLRQFSQRSNADIDLQMSGNAKMEQQLSNVISSVQKLYEENCQDALRNEVLCDSTTNLSDKVGYLQRGILDKRRKKHEKEAMKFTLEMRNQGLVRHYLDIVDVNKINAQKFGLQSIPDIEFVSVWMKSVGLERNLQQELQISQRRQSMLNFQVKRTKAKFRKSQEMKMGGPHCSPADTVRLSTKSGAGRTSTSNMTTDDGSTPL
ncbi:uncharacterized protein LOC132199509 [Neocloeon triangulifer]|uniref:uncharacterized protein LOC132199509 n=1 Tax=Neocloeon triangulifer TaxID=2078957 RepID=UPI00286FA862|nr:uncharacterized protein LOC132199509 [Neocloeon triangulifer]